jgi:hypothetical protein
MRRWTTRANRGGTLALLLMIPALLAGSGLRPAPPLPAAAIAAGFESDGYFASIVGGPPPTASELRAL